jgi:ferrochelatase
VIGIILLNLGGPDSIDAVRPFLLNLFSDREIIRLGPPFLQKTIASLVISMKLKKTLAAYNLIGGKSPLTDITTAQSKALEKQLNSFDAETRGLGDSGTVSSDDIVSPRRRIAVSPRQAKFRVYVGMRYWHPFTEESVEQMYKAGITKIIALSLYPHYCIATTGSSIKHFKDAAEKYSIEYSCITSWFNHPLYIDALAARIEQGLKGFSKKPAVLFSAHSLPQRLVNAGDSYIPEIRGTIDALTDKLDLQWFLSYQSKTGPVKWLEPTTEHMLHELAGKGIKDLLVVPVSFVSDHIETLYEIDILYKGMAKKLGITLQRIESLNTSDKFIEALADIVLKKTQDAGWI